MFTLGAKPVRNEETHGLVLGGMGQGTARYAVGRQCRDFVMRFPYTGPYPARIARTTLVYIPVDLYTGSCIVKPGSVACGRTF